MSTNGTTTGTHAATIRDPLQARLLIRRRYPEYIKVKALTDWVLDTLESGEQYKRAVYPANVPGGALGNLIRHRREWPISDVDGAVSRQEWQRRIEADDPTADPATTRIAAVNRANEQAYQIRLARTPTPSKLREILDKQVAQIYKQPPRRDVEGSPPDSTPPDSGSVAAVRSWWGDVDGKGTSIDEYMRDTIAPLLLAMGMLDIYCDHPSPEAAEAIQLPEPGEEWISGMTSPYWSGATPMMTPDLDDATVTPMGPPISPLGAVDPKLLSRCNIRYILPQNILWYKLDYTQRYYRELLVQEFRLDEKEPGLERYDPVYRHWTLSGWTLYDRFGGVMDEGTHDYGRIPIVRVFDRQHFRIPHAGMTRFLGTIERCREMYNTESELIYAMDLQCFSILQGPPIEGDDDGQGMPIGPAMMLQTQASPDGTTREGYSYLAPPVSPLEFVSQRIQWLSDQMDAEAGLLPPATARGSRGSSGGQKSSGSTPASGISKAFDQEEATNILAGMAMALETAEYVAAELAATVLMDRPPAVAEMEKVHIQYPRQFNLLRFDEMEAMIAAFIVLRDNCGYTPKWETFALQWIADQTNRGLDPKQREDMNQEIADYVAWQKDQRERSRSALQAANDALEAAPPGTMQPGPPGDVGPGVPTIPPPALPGFPRPSASQE